jgi:hypothetical protein
VGIAFHLPNETVMILSVIGLGRSQRISASVVETLYPFDLTVRCETRWRTRRFRVPGKRWKTLGDFPEGPVDVSLTYHGLSKAQSWKFTQPLDLFESMLALRVARVAPMPSPASRPFDKYRLDPPKEGRRWPNMAIVYGALALGTMAVAVALGIRQAGNGDAARGTPPTLAKTECDSELIELWRGEAGEFYLTATINSAPARELLLDLHSRTVTLPYETAVETNLVPDSDEVTLQAHFPTGDRWMTTAQLVVIPKLHIGSLKIENAECLVTPMGADKPPRPSLGLPFLRQHFDTKFSPESDALVLAKSDLGG